MDLADKWYALKDIEYEEEPGKSYYLLNNTKHYVYGKGNTGKCNAAVEIFFRINNITDKISPGKNYCSDSEYKKLYDKLLPTINEYIVNKFAGKLSQISDPSERNKIKILSDGYKSYYESVFTGIPDVDMQILINLSKYDLDSVCSVNKYINSLCTNDKFYKYRLDKCLEQTAKEGSEILPGELESIRNVIYGMYGKHDNKWEQLYRIFCDYEYYEPMEYSDMFYSIESIREYLGYNMIIGDYAPENSSILINKDLYMVIDNYEYKYDKYGRRRFNTIKITDKIKKTLKYKGYYIIPSLRIFGLKDDIEKYFGSIGVFPAVLEPHFTAVEKIE